MQVTTTKSKFPCCNCYKLTHHKIEINDKVYFQLCLDCSYGLHTVILGQDLDIE